MYTAVIIDDEKWVVASLRATLGDFTQLHVIGEARNGTDGLRLIDERKPDIVFLDISMPGMNGLQLLQTAEERGFTSLFVIVSGYAEFAYAQKAIRHGAIAYCLKPFTKVELGEVLQKAEGILRKGLKAEVPAPAEGSDSTREHNETVERMLDYIAKHYREDISIQNLADLFPLNANYASQLFSRCVGEHFSAYLTRVRIGEASRLLRESSLSVAEIASAVGYKDYFYFTKVFKKTAGCTPTQYKRSAPAHTEG